MNGKWNDYDSVMEEVKCKGSSLENASNELKNNYDIVMEAVKNAGYALQFASEELRNNPDIVLEAAKEAGYVLQYASDELKNNKEFVKRAVNQDDYAIYYVAQHFRDDPEITSIIKAKQQENVADQNNEQIENIDEKKVEEVQLELKDLDLELEHLKEQLRNTKQERDSQIEVLQNANSLLVKQNEDKQEDECEEKKLGFFARIKCFFKRMFSSKKVKELPDNIEVTDTLNDKYDSLNIEKVIQDENIVKLVNNFEKGIITENDINKCDLEAIKLALENQIEKIKLDIAKVNEQIV